MSDRGGGEEEVGERRREGLGAVPQHGKPGLQAGSRHVVPAEAFGRFTIALLLR